MCCFWVSCTVTMWSAQDDVKTPWTVFFFVVVTKWPQSHRHTTVPNYAVKIIHLVKRLSMEDSVTHFFPCVVCMCVCVYSPVNANCRECIPTETEAHLTELWHMLLSPNRPPQRLCLHVSTQTPAADGALCCPYEEPCTVSGRMLCGCVYYCWLYLCFCSAAPHTKSFKDDPFL